MRSLQLGLIACGVVAACSLTLVAQPGPGPGPGGPRSVPDLTPAQQLAFADGTRAFNKSYTVADGLGPVFNDDSCSDCHRNGGGSNRLVFRFGRIDSRGVFDPLVDFGGSLIQARGIGLTTTADGTHVFDGERIPLNAAVTVTTPRRSHSLLGLGFVDAVPDETFRAIAQAQLDADPSTAGRVSMVLELGTARAVVGKFGWKAQVPSLLHFSGDALLNEAGITNPLFRDENCPQGDCRALDFNPAPALNDNGRDTQAIADFMTMLAPPPRGPITDEVLIGEKVFLQIGCGTCHLPALRTGPSAIAALDRVEFHPYSDFLLHDMGVLGDRMPQGQAGGREMRTQPLWGLGTTTRFLHNVIAGTIEDAIDRHDGQGRAARDRFLRLSPARVASLLAFLRSL